MKNKNLSQIVAKQMREGLWTQNPTLVLLLGMCPMLATTTSAMSAFSMGLAALSILVITNTMISALRKFIPDEVRIVCYIVIIAGTVTAIDLLVQAFLPAISDMLGIFLPLVTVNCIIFARAETFASKNKVWRSALDGLTSGLGFLLALMLVGCIREVLGNGTIFGLDLTFGVISPVRLLAKPVGGFLVLGCVIAGAQAINNAIARRRQGKEEDV